ncbi:tetratricopeptide repeat protein [Fontivita pretiosa]|uniref:tetratricopeptide repeat protein n=1 Tax=Fontivita pretiosa TaxID=2989684 RepID=UPI003D16CB96
MTDYPQQAGRIEQVRELYERSLCVQALRLAQSIAPIRQWNFSPAARLLAGRLAANLGAPQLAAAMHYRAFREFPDDPEVRYYYARLLLERRGPLPAWEFLRSIGDLPDAPAWVRADWFAHHAAVARLFRDFDVAESWLDRAQQLAPQRPWLWIERSALLEAEDRYEQCLAAARQAMELRPGYRPAIQATAHALQLLDRDEEAMALLEDAAGRTESAPILSQLAMLQYELGCYDQAAKTLDRCQALSPLMEKHVARWLASRRCDLACAQGQIEQAIQHARELDDPFHTKIVENLSRPEARTSARRVLLDVAFVRQHHMTCAPATLAAISRYWSMPADHLAVVEEICYDGTPHHSERNWAETHGWIAREFTLTWESATTLIDRGVPFTLTTVEPDNAHLQAVVGYDSRRGTLLIRDPYVYYVIEMMAEPMLQRYRSSGPRAMAMVPRDRADLLGDGLELKDADLWDKTYAVQRALVRHDRDGAVRICAELEAASPDHLLTASTKRAIASYDGDSVAALAVFEKLLGQFPDDANLLLSKLSCLASLGRRQEYLALLAPLCSRSDSDPIFWQVYARELARDARQHAQAWRLLRRALRRRPRDAICYSLLGNILWDRGQREQAAELYRFSACLEDKNESLARTYFIASRHLGKAAQALEHLRARFQRLARSSGRAVRTLFWALEELNQTREALEVLDLALRLRPDDGELLLYAASCNARCGRFDTAQALLDRAAGAGMACAADRLCASAELASLRGDLQTARELWAQICRLQPLNVDAHARLAKLLAETQSPAAALAHLRAACERFPHHYGLQQLLLTWLRDEASPQEAEPVARRLVAAFPDDTWARRELAIALLRQQRYEPAETEVQIALRIDPSDAHSYALLGRIHLEARKTHQAREAFRQAISRSADIEYAISGLLDACDSTTQQREALAFVRDELRRQTTFGDGLLAFRQRAAELLPRQQVLALLREAHAARPDLWHAWSALVQQLLMMNQLDEAANLIELATSRFPLQPQLWLDRAEVCRARNDLHGQLAALETAVQISPGFGYAVRELAGAHERRGDLEKARSLLQSAIARSPLDAFNHGCLADLLWKSGQRAQAIQTIRHAVTLEPGYDWGWRALRRWAAELAQPQLLEEAIDDLLARRPGEARSWMILAENLTTAEKLEQRLAAVQKAIELSPRLIDAYDLKADLLASAGRIDEALAACAPAALVAEGGNVADLPAPLRARAAIILWNAGQRDQAVGRMRALADDTPQYYPAWAALSDWYRQLDQNDLFLETAQRMVVLFAQDPRVHGNLAEACEARGERAAAKAAYARAVQLAPDYPFAALSLFDMQIEDGETDAAQRTLAGVRGSAEPEHIVAREVILAARQGDAHAAAERLLALCSLDFQDPIFLNRAVDAMRQADMAQAIESTFEAACQRDSEINPLVGEVWMAQLTSQHHYDQAARLLQRLIDRGPLGAHAAARFLEAAAQHRQRRLVNRTLRTYGPKLRQSARTWGAVGYALTTLHQIRKMIQWMSDWPQRTDAEPWMLANLVMCLRRCGRDRDARAVIDHALSLPADNATPTLRAWRALDLALADNVAAAELELAQVDASMLEPYYQFVYCMASAQCAALSSDHRSPSAQRRQSLGQARQQLRRADAAVPNRLFAPELRRARRRVLWAIVRRFGSRTPLWCWWMLVGGTMPAPTATASGQS